MELLDPLHNDPVVHIQSLLDDEAILQFVPDDNLAPVRHVIPDDVNVPLVAYLEGCLLRNDDGVLQMLRDQHRAGLTVAQEALRVWEVGPEGYGAGVVLEARRNRTEPAG